MASKYGLVYYQIVLPSYLNPHEYTGYICINRLTFSSIFSLCLFDRCLFTPLCLSFQMLSVYGAVLRRGLCGDVYKALNTAPGFALRHILLQNLFPSTALAFYFIRRNCPKFFEEISSSFMSSPPTLILGSPQHH